MDMSQLVTFNDADSAESELSPPGPRDLAVRSLLRLVGAKGSQGLICGKFVTGAPNGLRKGGTVVGERWSACDATIGSYPQESGPFTTGLSPT